MENDSYEDDDENETHETTTAYELMPELMIQDQLGPPETALRRTAYLLVIQAPSQDWVAPLCLAAQRGRQWSGWVSRETPLKGSDDDGVRRLVRGLADGGKFFAISQDPSRLLAPALIALADETVVVPAPGKELLARVIKLVTGQLPIDLPDGIGSAMPFAQLAGCIRLSSTAAECVARLSKASAKASTVAGDDVSDAPFVENLHGYGAAAQWGKN